MSFGQCLWFFKIKFNPIIFKILFIIFILKKHETILSIRAREKLNIQLVPPIYFASCLTGIFIHFFIYILFHLGDNLIHIFTHNPFNSGDNFLRSLTSPGSTTTETSPAFQRPLFIPMTQITGKVLQITNYSLRIASFEVYTSKLFLGIACTVAY